MADVEPESGHVLSAEAAAAASSAALNGSSTPDRSASGKWLMSMPAPEIRRPMWDRVPVAGLAPSLTATSRNVLETDMQTVASDKRSGPHREGAGRSWGRTGDQMPRSLMIFATWPVALTL